MKVTLGKQARVSVVYLSVIEDSNESREESFPRVVRREKREAKLR